MIMAIKKEYIQISVVLPKDLVEERLDKDARKELRTRSRQAAKIILDYYNYGDEDDEERITVLAESNNEALLKKERIIDMGGKKFTGTCYVWWHNKDKMNQGIYDEWINGQQRIYCAGYAGANEIELIESFKENNESKEV
jgi:hypothetical protein